MEEQECQRLLDEAKLLEQRLDKYREWSRKMAAEENDLLDALKSLRARIAAGRAKAYALSARLSGIRAKLFDGDARDGAGSEAQSAER